MSWFGYKAPTTSESSEPQISPRTAKRKKLQEERLQRALQRDRLRKQLKSAQEAREAADLAEAELFALDPNIFEDTLDEEVSSDILEDSDTSANMPNEAIVAFEDEDGQNDDRALQEACSSLSRLQWDKDDLLFHFGQIEIKMAAVGVKKNFTKFQVLSTIIPKEVIDEVKPLLRMNETEFPNKDAYKQLKTEILRIFGPEPEDAVERALGRVLVGKPSQLARAVMNDITAKKQLQCENCAAVIQTLWKRQLPENVRAGIAHCSFNQESFKETLDLADKIFATNRPASVAAVSMNETQPAIPYPVPEVAAIRGGRGRGRRGGRGRGRGSSSGTQQSNNPSGAGQESGASRHKGPKHPDLPAGTWTGCQMHHKWGKGAFFCSEPSTCPWKNVFSPKPSK